MKDIVILASSGLAGEVAMLIEDINSNKKQWNLLGFVDNNKTDKIIYGYPIVGDDIWLKNYSKEIYATVAVGEPFLRKKIVDAVKSNHNIRYANLIAPDARVARSATIEEGCIIWNNCIISVNVRVGFNSGIHYGTTIGHGAQIGKYSFLAPGVSISGYDIIGEYVYIGTGAKIIQNIEIGEKSIIGAGAIVVKNIPSYCIAKGNPASYALRNDSHEK